MQLLQELRYGAADCGLTRPSRRSSVMTRPGIADTDFMGSTRSSAAAAIVSRAALHHRTSIRSSSPRAPSRWRLRRLPRQDSQFAGWRSVGGAPISRLVPPTDPASRVTPFFSPRRLRGAVAHARPRRRRGKERVRPGDALCMLFAGDRRLGETLQLNCPTYDCLGIMLPLPRLLQPHAEMWVPLAFRPAHLTSAGRTSYLVTTRLKLNDDRAPSELSVRRQLKILSGRVPDRLDLTVRHSMSMQPDGSAARSAPAQGSRISSPRQRRELRSRARLPQEGSRPSAPRLVRRLELCGSAVRERGVR